MHNYGEEKGNSEPVKNSKGVPYPEVIDIRTGKNMEFPANVGSRIPKDQRVPWFRNKKEADLHRNNSSDILCKKDYIDEWYKRGYSDPPEDWKNYEIHHIKPREFGGSASFENLVPVLINVHRSIVSPWGASYKG